MVTALAYCRKPSYFLSSDLVLLFWQFCRYNYTVYEAEPFTAGLFLKSLSEHPPDLELPWWTDSEDTVEQIN